MWRADCAAGSRLRHGCCEKQVEALRARERSVEIAGKRREVVALLAPLQSAFRADVWGQIGAVDESV